jgi:thymidylate synthase (FAD)
MTQEGNIQDMDLSRQLRANRFRKPQVFVIGMPAVNYIELYKYLTAIGAQGWSSDAHNGGQLLPEVYGRLCYRSFGVGLNKNVTKVREGNKAYLANINQSGHGAVLEHSNVNFIFHDVSRVFTHELVRHRVGVAISQESMRYVRLSDFKQYDDWLLTPSAKSMFDAACGYLENMIRELEASYDVDNQKFSIKKKITSLLRRIAPCGILTTIGWTANFRTLRHVIPLRTSVHAETEIREVFNEVAKKMTALFPNAFSDMKRNQLGEWKIEYPDTEKDALNKRIDELKEEISLLTQSLSRPQGGDS